MATNPYFKHFQHTGQQTLVENLIIESIKKYGYDIKYLPRNIQNIDQVFGEDALSIFDEAHEVEVYIKNVDGFAGQGKFLSTFGLEIRDQITFTVAKKRFGEAVAVDYERPREGDLIYFPLVDKIFEIKYVNYESIFYQLGKLQIYDLECELFEYSSERFNTQIDAIDNIEDLFSQDYSRKVLLDETGNPLKLEDGGHIVLEDAKVDTVDTHANNTIYAQEVEDIIDWSETSPLIRGNKFNKW